MIAPLADTAELPRVVPRRTEVVAEVRVAAPEVAPGTWVPVPVSVAPHAGQPGRRAQLKERRLARRQRRLAASLGLAVLAAFLAGAVVVVGAVR